jgi:hypothetical protein
MMRLALPATAVLLLALASGCSAAQHEPRTTPDPVERAALVDAQRPAKRDGVPIAPDVWTQLWTPTEAAAQIKNCVYQGSGGVLEFQAAPLAQQAAGMSYGIGASGDVSALSALGEFDDRRAVGRLLDSCVAAFPIDRRLWLVPGADRGALYSYDLTVLRRCLLAHGQHVPRMPSRTRFENLLRASAPWNAYDLVVVKNRAAWYALSDTCPALPPSIAADVTAVSASG